MTVKNAEDPMPRCRVRCLNCNHGFVTEAVYPVCPKCHRKKIKWFIKKEVGYETVIVDRSKERK